MKLSARWVALLLGVVAAMLTMVVPSAAHAKSTALDAPAAGGLYNLLNFQRGQCLAGMSSNRVNISGCNVTFSDQYWLIEPVSAAGYFRLRGLATSQCLAIISNGNVRTASCVDSWSDQWWRFDPTPAANSYMLSNYYRGSCLAAPRANGAATSFRCEPGFPLWQAQVRHREKVPF
jgi:hypothetical protein